MNKETNHGVITPLQNQVFAVNYEYPVYSTRGVFGPANPDFAEALERLEPAKRHRFVVFIDDGVAAAWPALAHDIAAYARRRGQRLELAAEPEILAGGESAKNDSALVERLQRHLLELGIDRHSFVVGIGGGAVLDLVGYVAGTTHRGVRLIRVPTTVLAQCDSGVGVKNCVNAFGVKNFLGTFAPPFAVLNDIDFIATLEPRDKIAGMAEAVKVALIRDAGFFHWLEANSDNLRDFEPSAMAYMIRHAGELHMRHIATGGDPFEFGSARPLDFGHWAAHKLESLSEHALRHGEAVAIGMALDIRYSVQRGLLPEDEAARIYGLLETLGFRLWHPAIEAEGANGEKAVLNGLREFREHLGGALSVTLLEGIGCGIEVHEVDTGRILRAVSWLKARDRPRCA